MKGYNQTVDDELWYESYFYRGPSSVLQFSKQGYLPVIGCTAYLCFVYFGPRYMKTKNRFNLRTEMLVWSTLLTIFSALGFWRGTLKTLEHTMMFGFRATICVNVLKDEGVPVFRFWAMAMMFSKFAEFGDTAFIIFRKQRLPFLHWYHHLTVSIFTWYNYVYPQPGSCFFSAMNIAVHAIMYFYYAMKAAKFSPPKGFAMLITILQTTQMFAGCITMALMVVWRNDSDCHSTITQRAYGTIMYGTYLILFVKFFYQAYINKKKLGYALANSNESHLNNAKNKTENKFKENTRKEKSS